MTAKFLQLMSSDTSRAMQADSGSRTTYAAMEGRAGESHDVLTPNEVAFIEARDSFYMATVTPDGWPYVQHRGGPKGFLRCLGSRRIGFADFRGNRQYMSAGNLAESNRVALIMLDYVARRRLKLVGHASRVTAADDEGTVRQLMPEGHKAMPEAAVVIDVVAFDWNCPQHITQRWTAAEIEQIVENEQ